jgi:hypothetical protein
MNNHSGEIETPEEYLDRIESEQRDFSGEEPTTEGHSPKYLILDEGAEIVPKRKKNIEKKIDTTRLSTLHEFTREHDESIEEYTETETEEHGEDS